jgi:hypothetical protein
MHTRVIMLGVGIAILAGTGCQHARPPTKATTRQEQIRVNCFSLLHQLLDQQRNVDKLLLVKKESAETHRLIKAIAAASAAGAKRLEYFAAGDRSVQLELVALPPGEVATRDAIARTKTKELLTPFNPDFELHLLLTQSEALSYAWHLARVAAANDTGMERSQYFSALSAEMKELHRQTVSLMHARTQLSQSNRR